jgi:hypothetical protein
LFYFHEYEACDELHDVEFVICRLIGYRHPSGCEFEEDAVGWVVKEEAGGDEQNNVGKTMMKTA